MSPSAEEIATVEALVEQIVAELKRGEAERLARYVQPSRRAWRVLTPAELAETRRRAGIWKAP